jgi:N-acetylglucosamine-6-phosphate deacetylase
MKCIGIDAIRGDAVIVEFDGAITAVDDLLTPIPDLPYLAPGFIDIQVNGYAGVDYNSPLTTAEDIERSLQVQFACGTTRLYPTVITGGVAEMRESLRNLAKAKASIEHGLAIEGFHVEGPHISPEDGPRGAHPIQHVRKPDFSEFESWQEATDGLIRLVTIAPEWLEAPAYIESVVRQGVVVSIGHTAANRQQIQDAVAAGATLSTHLGNGAHQQMLRHPNYIWEQMAEDRLAADFIVDGIHIGEAFLKVGLRAKGIERSILVTDASAPAGAKPGRYKLGEQDVDLTEDDRVVLAGQTRLAGSALKMHNGVSNLMRMAGLSLAEAVTMATKNPARVGRVSHRQRGLSTGERGDLIQFRVERATKQLQIEKTWISGQLVYAA